MTVEDYDLSVRFKCHADGEPPLKYQWLKDGKVLKYRLQKKKYVRFVQIVVKLPGPVAQKAGLVDPKVCRPT